MAQFLNTYFLLDAKVASIKKQLNGLCRLSDDILAECEIEFNDARGRGDPPDSGFILITWQSLLARFYFCLLLCFS